MSSKVEWALVFLAFIMVFGFCHTMSQIPRELRGGIYSRIDGYRVDIDNRVNILEKTFDKHTAILTNKFKELETKCSSQGNYLISPTSHKNRGYTYSRP